MLPADELRELSAAANQTAATMAATATEVVSMERAISHAPQSRPHLVPTIKAFTAQLDRACGSTTKWSLRLRNWCQRRTRVDVELADVATALPQRVDRRD